MKILTLCALLVISSSCAERRVCKVITITDIRIGQQSLKSELPQILKDTNIDIDVCLPL